MVSTHENLTAYRVEEHTPDHVNSRFQRQLEANVAYYAQRLDDIEQRLAELDQEWDMERMIEANAGTLALLGLVGSLVWRKTSVLSAVVAGFLLQHALQGWCPPVSIFRRLGVRTWREIDRERYALKALRGDFQAVNGQGDEAPAVKARQALDAADYHG